MAPRRAASIMESSREEVLLHVLDERLKTIANDVRDIKQQFDKYVTKHEFRPVMLLAYGFAATIMTSVVAAIIALVVK